VQRSKSWLRGPAHGRKWPTRAQPNLAYGVPTVAIQSSFLGPNAAGPAQHQHLAEARWSVHGHARRWCRTHNMWPWRGRRRVDGDHILTSRFIEFLCTSPAWSGGLVHTRRRRWLKGWLCEVKAVFWRAVVRWSTVASEELV
jgi:hypothetical protein